jgi:outer membrane protein assembly factor BamB
MVRCQPAGAPAGSLNGEQFPTTVVCARDAVICMRMFGAGPEGVCQARCSTLWLSPAAECQIAAGRRARRPILRLSSARRARVHLAVAAGMSIMVLTFGVETAAAAPAASWPSGGHDTSNSHSQPAETQINPQNVVHLAPKWTFTTYGDVSAIPAVVGGAVYFPDWGGYLNKVDPTTGKLIWQTQIDSYLSDLGITGGVSRAAPAVVGNTVYLGDQNGGHLFAVNATTGQLIWRTQVDSRPFAILTAGPLVVNGVIYQGVASLEEGVAANGSYPCCIFRGSIVAVDAATGHTLWNTYMTPDNGGQPCTTQGDPTANPPIPISGCGYSGASVWGTTPTYDPASNTLFVTTGNNYTVADSVKQCEANHGTPGQCLDPNDHVDSILALNASTGAIKWATGTGKFDDWNVACIPGFGVPNSCPANPGPDYDFGSGPSCSRSRTRPAGRNSSSARARRAVSTGRSTRPRARSSGAMGGPRLDARRNRVGPRDRRQAHLRRRGELQRHPIRPEQDHERGVGCDRPGDRPDPLANPRPEPQRVRWREHTRTGIGGRRRRVRPIDERQHIRARRQHRQDPVELQDTRRSDRRRGDRQRKRVLGRRIHAPRDPRLERKHDVLRLHCNGN